MATKLMLVQGMTCPACERKIVDALIGAGGRDVRADSQRGEVVLDPGDASEGQLREAVNALGYRAAGSLQSLPREPIAQLQTGSHHWTPLLLLLPAICCGAPLLLAAAAALGFGTWFAANGLLLVSGLVLGVAVVSAALWLGRGVLR